VEGKPAPLPGNEPNAVYRVAMPGYFRTMGMKLARGRDFDERDREGAQAIAVVNETMARRLWPSEDAIGRRFRVNSMGGDAAWLTVVGVLRDARQWGWSDPTSNEMYLPYAQDPSYQHSRMSFLTMMLVVKTAPPPGGLGAPIRAQLRSIDPDVPVTAIQNMEQVTGDAVWQQRMEMSVLSGFASLALVLAVVGIYAVMSYVVGGRTQEIGIRMALGAARRDVLGMVLSQSLRPVALGLVAGVLGAAGLTQWMGKMLYGVKAADPSVLAGAAVLLGVVAVGAAMIPANRAARVDPLTALRQE
ncbi:MAG TPA: FtsX-like permease family protein, partial [Candidatus Acidoferrum sp.]|nr:FtsX-like permease family protein [Candidatus Acidoferrum sp.]